MKILQNESKVDRGIRMVLGMAIALVSFTYLEGTLQLIALIISLVLLVTGFTGFCLLYKLLGINTKK
ncbi:DUF2892 domain-containing protein [Candidatus Woesebacteria bacterium]|nr:MAG: DUF2892 domain-containing protein [Candidatus Woesebacteria bacterium]